MPLLKDYLGSLVSGINQARAMADVESAKIAEAYSENALLKHFSVPRFKASNIELDIPIAIDVLEEVEEADYQPINNRSFNSFSYHVFKDTLKVARFTRKESELLRKRIAKETDQLERNLKAKEDVHKSLKDYAANLSQYFVNEMQDTDVVKNSKKMLAESDETLDLQAKLIKSLQAKLTTKIRPPKKSIDMDNTKVLVQAHQLREIPPESMVRIKMTLVEEGMEWQTIERDDGGVDQKLLPE